MIFKLMYTVILITRNSTYKIQCNIISCMTCAGFQSTFEIKQHRNCSGLNEQKHEIDGKLNYNKTTNRLNHF